MSQTSMKLVAVILAGGVGARMATTGTQIPKVYLPVGIEPVINRPVSRCLEINTIEKINILTRKAHPDLPDVNLQQWAETWRSLWWKRDRYPQVEITYEENLDPLPIPIQDGGAIAALAQIASNFAEWTAPPSHVLVMAGDNFLDCSIESLVRASQESPEDVVIAIRPLANRALARKRFGVVQVDERGGESNPVISYQEKPENPRSSEISIGLYIFPLEKLLAIKAYLAEVANLAPEEQKISAGAPGYFLEWLVKRGEPVQAVMLREGIWVDVGTPASFLTAIVQLTKNLIERPQSARDLDVLGSTKDLSDKYYFLCHRAKIKRTSQENIIEMYFQGDDTIATLKKEAATRGRVIDVAQIVSDNKKRNSEFWSVLINGEISDFSDGADAPRSLETPILISGGVFLIDRGGDHEYQPGKAFVPFLVRDFGAPVDAGRLTTAAGRMDKLDLLDVCASEHAEEMIFFGSSDANNSARSVRLFLSAPPGWLSVARETILGRLARNRNLCPLIDSKQVELEMRRPTGLIAQMDTSVLAPPANHNWKVRIYYRDSDDEEWQLRHDHKNMVLIPDQKSATLEFRVLWFSAITSDVGRSPVYDRDAASLGRLLGITDGDGHSRTALMVKAQSLINYIHGIKKQTIQDILFASDDADKPALDVMAVTDGHAGRFISTGRKLRLASLTTSVHYFAELLKGDLKIAEGN